MLCPVCLVAAAGGGTIRIDPAYTIVVVSPADFDIWVTQGETSDPHIFLVMTETCYNGFTGNVKIDWTGGGTTIPKGSFTKEEDENAWLPDDPNVPDVSNIRYKLAQLWSHIGSEEPLWWAFVPFLSGTLLTTNPTSFTVTFSSTNPRMLVYALGKTDGSTEFNNRIPPTKPGFMVPEPATIVAVATSLIALIGYTTLKNKNLL